MNRNTIQALNYKVYFHHEGTMFLNNFIADTHPSKLFFLADSHTHPECLPMLLQSLSTNIPIEIIEIEAGEPHKNIDTCTQVWYALSELGADRHSLLINVGGGVVTDLGGFVASTYMRGIRFINVPTSLLAMVDASVGGKTGVDLGALKNLIGVINTPEAVIVLPEFLATLPSDEMRSGMAEMFKHGLISSETYWNKMCHLSEFGTEHLATLIYESILIKNEIVTIDPTEKGLRKTLNFGHTLGHAIESYCLQNPNRKRLLHGEAIAIGMVLAAYLSVKLTGFAQDHCNKIKTVLGEYFSKQYFSQEEVTEICQLLRFDKKNKGGNVLFVLLEAIGKPKIDCIVPFEEIYKAFNFYQLTSNN